MKPTVTSSTLVLVPALALAGTAMAQPGTVKPATVSVVDAPSTASASALPASPTAAASDGELNPDTAFVLSFGGTLASWTVFAVGAQQASVPLLTLGLTSSILAPSLGHWYARSSGLAGIGLRVTGAAALVGGLYVAAFEILDSDSGSGADGLVLAGAGATLLIASTIYDLATAGRDARQYNERSHQLAIAPLVRRDDHGVGLALTGRF